MRLPVFFTAPHRVMFAGGVTLALLAMVLWSWELQGRYSAVLPLPTWPWPPAWVHAGLMIFGVFPWFIFGFLMTALPKWMASPPLKVGEYLPAFLCLVAGWAAMVVALGYAGLAPWGLGMVMAGWLWSTGVLARKVLASSNERRHALAVLVSLLFGVAAIGAYAVALAKVDANWFRAATAIGLWCSLLPVFFIVLHRMLPFFTGAVVRGYRAYQPMWALLAVLAAFFAHGVLVALDLAVWAWPIDALAAAVLVHLSARWGLKASLDHPMLAMIHLGALWLAFGLSLFAVQGALNWRGISWGGLLPLHALGGGFFGSILIGMATRVTLGHSGRPIAGDRWGWRLFLAYQGVVALRLAGEVWPACNLAAAVGWLLVFGAWAAVHFPMYLRQRPDGQAG